MADEAGRLTQAVTDIATKHDALNATLQTEMQQIADALAGAGDAALRDAANEAIARLSTVATRMDEMNTVIQGIVP